MKLYNYLRKILKNTNRQMRCKECNTTLSPFLLRQVHEEEKGLMFEIECPNPYCRHLNMVSKEFYFYVKNDFYQTHKKEETLSLTNKLPGEANVMFLSMERCGISWIVRRLSKIHELMFGKPIKYTPEISRVIATRERFPLPKGWYNVYSVDPRTLLERDYDKVISVQRPKKVLYRVMSMYYMPDLTYSECREQYPKYFDKIDAYYEKVYGEVDEIDDKRYLNITLPDLNNYTAVMFHRLMDFLNFPKQNRPVIFPVNPPERNWQAFSTTLGKDEEIGAKLRQMQLKYGNAELEYDLQKKEEKEGLKKRRQKAKRGKEQKYKSQAEEQTSKKKKPKKKKVPKLVSFESRVQASRKFRMYKEDVPDALEQKGYKIVVISPTGYNLGCHMGEKMAEAFKDLGHEVALISYNDIKKKRLHGKESLTISELLKTFLEHKILKYHKRPDFIFVNQLRTPLINDLEAHEIPVFYFHTGWYQELGVKGPNIVNYFRHDRLTNIYAKTGTGNVHKTLYHAVDPKIFYPAEKMVKGVCGIGYRRSWGDFKRITEDMRPFVEIMQLETEQFKEQGFKYYETPITDIEYRNIIKKIEAFNPILSFDSYVSRRTLEAMACKTLVILRLSFTVDKDGNKDTSIHRNILKKMGYKAGRDYIEVDNMYDIKETWESLTEDDKKRIKGSAYRITLANHTHRSRAKQIIRDFESGIWRKGYNE